MFRFFKTLLPREKTANLSTVESVVTDATATASLLPKRGSSVLKRTDNSGCSACKPQPTTQNYLNANVNSDTEFLADKNIAAAASNAPTPDGYSKVFTNLQAASNGYVCKLNARGITPSIEKSTPVKTRT